MSVNPSAYLHPSSCVFYESIHYAHWYLCCCRTKHRNSKFLCSVSSAKTENKASDLNNVWLSVSVFMYVCKRKLVFSDRRRSRRYYFWKGFIICFSLLLRWLEAYCGFDGSFFYLLFYEAFIKRSAVWKINLLEFQLNFNIFIFIYEASKGEWLIKRVYLFRL